MVSIGRQAPALPPARDYVDVQFQGLTAAGEVGNPWEEAPAPFVIPSCPLPPA